MTLTQLISEATEALSTHGDIDVWVYVCEIAEVNYSHEDREESVDTGMDCKGNMIFTVLGE